MEFFVYVLVCRDARRHITYVGWTTDPERRLGEHNAGTGAQSTRGRTWVLLHVERLASRREAMSREWHLKRDRSLRKRLVEDWIEAGPAARRAYRPRLPNAGRSGPV